MSIRNVRRVRNQPRQQDEAVSAFNMSRPRMPFDDSNRENYIMRSGMFGQPTIADMKAKDVAPLQIFPPNPDPNIIVDYEAGKGGRDSSMLPNFTATIEPVIDVTPGPVDMMPSPVNPLPADSLGDRLRDLLDMDLKDVPQGQVLMADGLPFNLFQDPTADGGIIDYLSRKLFGDDDPENDFSNPVLPPSDGFEPYDPNNPNMFMLPDGMELDDMPMEDILEMMQGEKLEASADSYSLPNLLQMLNDAKDAGDDSYDTILEDIELRYPGATMDVAELTDAQKNFMLSPLQNPNFQSREDLFNKVKQMEDKGFFGFGAQEPTTMEEMLEIMNTDAYRRAFS